MRNKKVYVLFFALIAIFLVLSIVFNKNAPPSESIKAVMKDAVLHEDNKMSLFGITVNPAVVSGFTVTGVVLLISLLLRVLVIPRFKMNPGRVQIILEQIVEMFNKLASSNSPHKYKFLSAYVFSAGMYIFVGTMFELFGIQALTTTGMSMSLPAPLSDINAAIALGVLSYCIILSGGITSNGVKGVLNTLKDFSLPISMSFRLFGALLSGLLVNELVYHYIHLSFVLPVFVAIMFTLLHAFIQAYVLTMLTALFYGEVSE